MEGKQKSAYEQTMDIASKLKDGFYGQGNEIDADSFFDDFEDIYNELEK